MGVSLERVQFKFASIIGELCSEPDVLSQFAVWLDLRLAEYKLKGNISLDGFGDEPDPAWLKGLNKGKSKNLNYQTDLQTENMSPHTSAERVEPVQLTQNLVHSNALNFHSITMPMATVPGPSLMLQERLPVSVAVTIKKERNESLYSHCSAAKIFPTTPDMSSRKRTVPNFCVNSNQSTRGLQLPTCTQPKQRRLSLPTVTQSSGNQIPASASYDQGILNGRSGENSKRPTPIPMTTSPRLRSSLDSQSNQSNDHSENKEPNFTEDFYHDNVAAAVDKIIKEASALPPGALWIPGLSVASEKKNRVRKLRASGSVCKSEIPKLTASVETLEHWLWQNLNYKEERSIEDIPGDLLDKYLADFFSNFQPPWNEELNPKSFSTLVLNIDRYLLELGAAESIRDSKTLTFIKCQDAFRKRHKALQEKWDEKKLLKN